MQNWEKFVVRSLQKYFEKFLMREVFMQNKSHHPHPFQPPPSLPLPITLAYHVDMSGVFFFTAIHHPHKGITQQFFFLWINTNDKHSWLSLLLLLLFSPIEFINYFLKWREKKFPRREIWKVFPQNYPNPIFMNRKFSGWDKSILAT
jgi:hypothetical protein